MGKGSVKNKLLCFIRHLCTQFVFIIKTTQIEVL